MQDLKDFKLSSASGGSPVSSPLASAAIWFFWTALNHNCRMDVDGGCVCGCTVVTWMMMLLMMKIRMIVCVCVCGWIAVATLTRSRIICGYGLFHTCPVLLSIAGKFLHNFYSYFIKCCIKESGVPSVKFVDVIVGHLWNRSGGSIQYIALLMKHNEPESCCFFKIHQKCQKVIIIGHWYTILWCSYDAGKGVANVIL